MRGGLKEKNRGYVLCHVFVVREKMQKDICAEDDEQSYDFSLPATFAELGLGTLRRQVQQPVRVCFVQIETDPELEELLYRRVLEARVRAYNGFNNSP
jgi:hypothetical protein